MKNQDCSTGILTQIKSDITIITAKQPTVNFVSNKQIQNILP